MRENGPQCVDVYLSHRRFWMRRYAFEKRENKYGFYLHTETEGRRLKRLIRRLEHKHIKYRVYDRQYTRSGNYREKYFNHHDSPYRCLYCHRRLRKQDVTIDHIVPVGMAKVSRKARRILHRQGSDNVNDLPNLAACCYRCNQRKGDKLGIWMIRARLGSHAGYWVFRKLLIVVLIIIALLAVRQICIYFGLDLISLLR